MPDEDISCPENFEVVGCGFAVRFLNLAVKYFVEFSGEEPAVNSKATGKVGYPCPGLFCQACSGVN